MPIHDWTRVNAATFHDFHGSWIIHLKEALNAGLLPPPYYAQSEQVATRMQADVLTLRASLGPSPEGNGTVEGGVAVAEAPPRVQLSVRPNPKTPPKKPARRRRRVVVRHVSGHQVVAVIEIVSPANKDRRDSVRELAGKVVGLLEADVQVLLLDLLPPGRHDPHGLHGAVWGHFDSTPYLPPTDAPLTLASYVWQGTEPQAYLQPVGVGQALSDMPLFLNRERYVNVPLEATYQAAYRGVPAVWRGVIEGA
jgi:hypothetical protein